MNISHIDQLRATLQDVFQDAADHHEIMAEETGEAVHLAIRNEYLSGIATLGSLVDRNDRFVDHEAIILVRQSLTDYLNEIRDRFPLKRRRLQILTSEIDIVEKALWGEVHGAA